MAKGTVKMDNLGMIYPTISLNKMQSINLAKILSNLDEREFNIEIDKEVLYLSLPYEEKELISKVLKKFFY